MFGINEALKAQAAFVSIKEYKSESLYYRSVTKALNDVLQRFPNYSSPLQRDKPFKTMLAICGQFPKIQQMPCRVCKKVLRNGEPSTIFGGLGRPDVSVAHSSCIPKDAI